MDKNSYGEALPYFLEVLKLEPLDLPTLHNLGAVYLKMENFEKASEQYQKLLGIDPENKEISYILAALKQENTPSKAPKEYLEHLFDQYAPRFDAHLAQFLKYRVPDLLLEATEEFLRKDLNILDLGCGTGLGGEKFRSFAKKLIGIDISSKMLDLAREKKIYDELILADIHTALTSYQKEFDLILAADSLVYSGDLESIFIDAKKALKSEGYFAFTCEKGEIYPYNLQTNARFAHHQKYIQELALKYNLKILKHAAIILRQQQVADVPGEIYLLSST
jgi:predicted TPR repeat methyltransferase